MLYIPIEYSLFCVYFLFVCNKLFGSLMRLKVGIWGKIWIFAFLMRFFSTLQNVRSFPCNAMFKLSDLPGQTSKFYQTNYCVFGAWLNRSDISNRCDTQGTNENHLQRMHNLNSPVTWIPTFAPVHKFTCSLLLFGGFKKFTKLFYSPKSQIFKWDDVNH
jgi:hypothetical protein